MIIYFIFILIIFFLIIYIFTFINKRKIKKSIEKIKTNWGCKLERVRNFAEIEKYLPFDKNFDCYTLTEQTLIDIDIQNLFHFIDRTITTIGQQYLYSKIVKPSININELEIRGKHADFFQKNDTLRLKTQIVLQNLEKKSTDLITDIFYTNTAIDNKKLYTTIIVLSVLALTSILFCLLTPKIAIVLIFLFGVNLLVHLIYRYYNSRKLKTIQQVYQLLNTVDKLMKLKLPITLEKKSYIDFTFKRFKKVYPFLNFGIPTNDISGIIFYFFDLIKSFFLIEIHLLNFTFNEIIKNKDSLNLLFTYIGQIEMSLSTASIMYSKIEYCKPIFITNKTNLACQDALHPLIINCIPNSMQLYQTNAFITGSNMSGKSTFLRTILINSILSQSLFIAFAKEFTSPILKILSSIKISDNLEEGTSYFFKEVSLILEMIIHSRSESKNLFVIDEIFKGTNTIERISLAKAVLSNLSSGNNNIVIASSHDIELIELIGNKFRHFHFTESIINNELQFDYIIKDGPITTRNAIKITEIAGFPADVINEANAIASSFFINSLSCFTKK
ncbi:hypothetical protein [Hydrotalea sp.]|uniref:MutS-related protein n=1 Tax=Hydrotalea sp. TaxID=2881279 RepID=UPI00261493F2|nr:hypothetical protein [Hydrotalea sp.]